MSQSYIDHATELLNEGRLAEARAILEDELAKMPDGWSPVRQEADGLSISFWTKEEFLEYLDRKRETLNQSVSWVFDSYSRALYLLASVASEEQRFEAGLMPVDRGLALEDHPELWCLRGFLLARLKRDDEALECFIRAETVRDWATAGQVARALRGQGAVLIDLNRFEEAEEALRRSLDLEPGNALARNELYYMELVRRKRDPLEGLPWFIHALACPPVDPLTIQLLALVEDLPSIPGAETVGEEEYSRILRAIMQGGWGRFEEEFDLTVPRSHPDYAEVKRDLLRDPMFGKRMHRSFAVLLLGKDKVDELLGEKLPIGTKEH